MGAIVFKCVERVKASPKCVFFAYFCKPWSLCFSVRDGKRVFVLVCSGAADGREHHSGCLEYRLCGFRRLQGSFVVALVQGLLAGLRIISWLPLRFVGGVSAF